MRDRPASPFRFEINADREKKKDSDPEDFKESAGQKTEEKDGLPHSADHLARLSGLQQDHVDDGACCFAEQMAQQAEHQQGGEPAPVVCGKKRGEEKSPCRFVGRASFRILQGLDAEKSKTDIKKDLPSGVFFI